MQVQAVNNHAATRYKNFESAIESVRIAVEESDRLITAMREESGSRCHGWQVPTKKEVLACRRRAAGLLDELRAKAKEYESELISRGWRV